jgi:hypothetical protein
MDSIVLFFELGYIFNIIGLAILIYFIKQRRHIEGLSYYTQLLFAISAFSKIFYFPFTILKEYPICWIEFVLTMALSLLVMVYMRSFKRISTSPEKNFFDYRIILVVSLVLAAFSNYDKSYDFEWSQLALRFSIILEAIGLLPQLRLMRQEQFVQKFIGYYLVSISASRICRVFFWIYQVKSNYNDDSYWTLIIADSLYILLTADFVYNFIKHYNKNLIPYN